MQDRQEARALGEPWEMDEVLRKVRGICLKDYTRAECLKAAEGAPFGPDQCRRLGEMLYMRAGRRGDMSIEDLMQRLFPAGDHCGAAQPAPAELHDLAIHTAAVLAPHQQRVVQEAVENQSRLDALTAFMAGQVFVTELPDVDRRLLYRQHAAMTELAFVLAARIQRFKGAAS